MPAGDIDVVLRFWQAADSGRGVQDLLHEDIEVSDFDLPDAGVYRGHAGFARWVADWGEPWDDYRSHVLDLFDLDGQVASLTRLEARTMDNLEVNRHDSQLITMADGKIARLEYFGKAQTALERAADPNRAATRKVVHDKVRALYAAALRGDVEAVVAQISPDYAFYPEADSPMDPAYKGHGGARRYFRELFDAWEMLEFDVQRLIDSEDDVVALFRMRNRGRGSGIELTEDWAEVWETAGDQIMASRFHTSHQAALAAAGLA